MRQSHNSSNLRRRLSPSWEVSSYIILLPVELGCPNKRVGRKPEELDQCRCTRPWLDLITHVVAANVMILLFIVKLVQRLHEGRCRRCAALVSVDWSAAIFVQKFVFSIEYKMVTPLMRWLFPEKIHILWPKFSRHVPSSQIMFLWLWWWARCYNCCCIYLPIIIYFCKSTDSPTWDGGVWKCFF